MPPPKVPTLFTLLQTAELLQVSTRTVTRAIAAGGLKSHKVGRQIRISQDDLTAFLAVRRS